jgi:hypothetical protein
MKTTSSCSNCRFCRKGSPESENGGSTAVMWCQRFPPTEQAIGREPDVRWYPIFPRTRANFWCGSWQPEDSARKRETGKTGEIAAGKTRQE